MGQRGVSTARTRYKHGCFGAWTVVLTDVSTDWLHSRAQVVDCQTLNCCMRQSSGECIATWLARSLVPAAHKQLRPSVGIAIMSLTHLQQHGVVKRLSQLLACLQGPLLTALLLLTLLHLLTLTLLSLWLDL